MPAYGQKKDLNVIILLSCCKRKWMLILAYGKKKDVNMMWPLTCLKSRKMLMLAHGQMNCYNVTLLLRRK